MDYRTYADHDEYLAYMARSNAPVIRKLLEDLEKVRPCLFVLALYVFAAHQWRTRDEFRQIRGRSVAHKGCRP
eukprot:1195708-Prorocentrum_minimum.AAC.8